MNKYVIDFSNVEFLVILPNGKRYLHKWDNYLKENFDPAWDKNFNIYYTPAKNKRTLLNEKSIKKTKTNYTENNC